MELFGCFNVSGNYFDTHLSHKTKKPLSCARYPLVAVQIRSFLLDCVLELFLRSAESNYP